MLFKKNKRLCAAHVRVEEILDRGLTCRRFRDEEKQAELQASIAQAGILEPLHLCRAQGGYILISGGRRLEAAKRLGLKTVPAVIEEGLSEAELLTRAFVENNRKESFSVFEQAELLRRIMALRGLNEAETARLLGLEEETVRARLKLLHFEAEAATVCEAAGLSEKWINRVAAMPPRERDKLFFGLLNEGEDLVSRASRLRERLRLDCDEPPMRTIAIKDVRIFFNTIDRAVEVMQHAGVEATTERHDFDGLVEYYIRIPCGTPARR